MASTMDCVCQSGGRYMRKIASYAFLSSCPLSALTTHASIRDPANSAPYSTALSERRILPGDRLLDLVRFHRQRATENLRAVSRHQHDVLDTDADFFFGDINARLNRNHHTSLERRVGIGRIVYF